MKSLLLLTTLACSLSSCQSSSPTEKIAGSIEAAILQNEPSNLHEAVLHGKLKKVDAFITQGADVNALNAHGYTPLMMAPASLCATLEPSSQDAAMKVLLIKKLLKAGADVNARVPKGEFAYPAGTTALMLACESGGDSIDALGGQCDPLVVKALLDAGAKAQLKDAKGHSALSRAKESLESAEGESKLKIQQSIELLKKAATR